MAAGIGTLALVLTLAAAGPRSLCGEEPAAAVDDEPPPFTTPYHFTGRGLLDFKDLFPTALLHLQLPVDTLLVLDEGEWELSLGFLWGNNHGLDDKFTIDAETYYLEFSAWYAFSDALYIGASLPAIGRDEGILDPLIEEFHETFGFSNRQRNMRKINDYEVEILGEDGRFHRLDRGIGLGDLVFKVHWNAYSGSAWLPAVAVEGLMSIPTSMEGFGGDSVDWGVAVSFHKTFYEVIHLHLVSGGLFYSDTRTKGLEYERLGYQIAGGIEWEVTEDLSLILQGFNLSPQLVSPSPLNDPRNYAGGGLKWRFAEGWEAVLSVIENFAPANNSSDIVIGLAFTYRL